MIIPWVYDQTPTGFAQLAMGPWLEPPGAPDFATSKMAMAVRTALKTCHRAVRDLLCRRKCGTARDL